MSSVRSLWGKLVESGQVKRSMFGRASYMLLRAKLLFANKT